jgi:HD-GYP domain-containing protein (c-di-GMP phosphodiesterase class II)
MPERTPAARSTARLPVWRRLSWRLAASFLLLTALGILFSGLLQYRAQEALLRENLGALLRNIARTGALLIDGDLHQAVVQAGRNDSPEYFAIRDQLERIRATNGLGDAVYTLSHVEGMMARFAAISHGQLRVGEPYELAPEIQPVLKRVLQEGVAAFTGIYRDKNGVWITAFAPLKNRAGTTVAVLDVDYRAGVYMAELAALKRRLYLHSLVAAVAAALAGALLARSITRPVAQLAAAARSVVEGDLTAKVQVAARDEIGMLGNVLHLMVERVHVSHRSMVDVLVRALEARDGEAGSLPRLAAAALGVAERLELTPGQREALELGALLHDIGQIRTPETVLQKPGPLTPAERAIIAQHPPAGVDILEPVPLLTPALDVVGAHHERFDGTGYPHKLQGEDIPFTARIFAVVDALDAMTHDRPYRPARPLAEALAEVRREEGGQFDARIVQAALAIPEARWAEWLGLPTPGEIAGAAAPAAAPALR